VGTGIRSILQKKKRCLVCDSPDVEEHHVFEGSRRRASETYGMKVYLCLEHHRGRPRGVHADAAFAAWLKREAQKIFERRYGHDVFMQVFKKNYI
jgi:hypothetical protein